MRKIFALWNKNKILSLCKYPRNLIAVKIWLKKDYNCYENLKKMIFFTKRKITWVLSMYIVFISLLYAILIFSCIFLQFCGQFFSRQTLLEKNIAHYSSWVQEICVKDMPHNGSWVQEISVSDVALRFMGWRNTSKLRRTTVHGHRENMNERCRNLVHEFAALRGKRPNIAMPQFKSVCI